jgi:ribosomal protein S26
MFRSGLTVSGLAKVYYIYKITSRKMHWPLRHAVYSEVIAVYCENRRKQIQSVGKTPGSKWVVHIITTVQ